MRNFSTFTVNSEIFARVLFSRNGEIIMSFIDIGNLVADFKCSKYVF